MIPGQIFNPFRMFVGAITPNWLMESRQVSQGAKLCYARLSQFAGETGECWPGQQALADSLGVDVRQVRRYLSDLQEAGLIEIQQRGLNRSNVYVFLWREEIANRPLAQKTESKGPDIYVPSGADTYDRTGPDTSVRSRGDVKVRSRPDVSVRSPIGRRESSKRIIESSSSSFHARPEEEEDLSGLRNAIAEHVVATDSDVAQILRVGRSARPGSTVEDVALAVSISVPSRYRVDHVRYFLTAVPRTMASQRYRNLVSPPPAHQPVPAGLPDESWDQFMERVRAEDPALYAAMVADEAAHTGRSAA